MNISLKKRSDGESGCRKHSMAWVDMRRIHTISCFILACWVLWNPSQALSANGGNSEYPIKLAFLYNFTKFVEWPPKSYQNLGAPLAICIVGDDPFSPDLEIELRTRTVEGHPVEVRRLRLSDILSSCHIVFIPVTEKNQANRILTSLKGSSTLTVGEIEGF